MVNEGMNKNVLVVGSKNAKTHILNNLGCRVVDHWSDMKLRDTICLRDIDVAVLVSDEGNVHLAQMAEKLCKQAGVPLIRTKSDWQQLRNILSDPERMQEIEDEVDSEDEVNEVNLNGGSTMSKSTDGRSFGKNVQKAQEKLNFVRTLLQQNKLMPTSEILKQVEGEFGKAITPSKVNGLRAQEFNVQFGPRGSIIESNVPRHHKKAHEKVKKLMVEPEIGFTAPKSSSASANAALAVIVKQLQSDLKTHNIRQITIPADGPADAVFEVHGLIQ